MATAIITFGSGSPYSVFHGETVRSESVTTSGTSASGALTATVADIAMIWCATAVYARSGGTVSAANGAYCPAGQAQYIRMTEGDVVSLIDA